MLRMCLVAMVICAAHQAEADTGRPGQRADLQVGGPLRAIPERRDGEPARPAAKIVTTDHPLEPAHGVSSSLAHVLNTDGYRLIDPDLEEDRRSGLAYAVTGSLSLGFRYHFVAAEDLVGDLAAAGTLNADHQSHHVLLRARWRFP